MKHEMPIIKRQIALTAGFDGSVDNKISAPPDKKPKYIFLDIYLDTFFRWYIPFSINQ